MKIFVRDSKGNQEITNNYIINIKEKINLLIKIWFYNEKIL